MSTHRVWRFTRRPRIDENGVAQGEPETRTYIQQELTLDGEFHLFNLIAEGVPILKRADFPFERIMDVFPDEDIDASFGPEALAAVADMARVAASVAPDIITRMAAIVLGVFPTDIDRSPNPAYDDHVMFLRSSMKSADVVEMVETFIEQNDIERLRAPFARAWERMTKTSAYEATTQERAARVASAMRDQSPR
jgi:hypothetical protein